MEVQTWAPGWSTARLAPDLGSPDTLTSTNGWLIANGGQTSVPAQAVRAEDLFAN